MKCNRGLLNAQNLRDTGHVMMLVNQLYNLQFNQIQRTHTPLPYPGPPIEDDLMLVFINRENTGPLWKSEAKPFPKESCS